MLRDVSDPSGSNLIEVTTPLPLTGHSLHETLDEVTSFWWDRLVELIGPGQAKSGRDKNKIILLRRRALDTAEDSAKATLTASSTFSKKTDRPSRGELTMRSWIELDDVEQTLVAKYSVATRDGGGRSETRGQGDLIIVDGFLNPEKLGLGRRREEELEWDVVVVPDANTGEDTLNGSLKGEAFVDPLRTHPSTTRASSVVTRLREEQDDMSSSTNVNLRERPASNSEAASKSIASRDASYPQRPHRFIDKASSATSTTEARSDALSVPATRTDPHLTREQRDYTGTDSTVTGTNRTAHLPASLARVERAMGGQRDNATGCCSAKMDVPVRGKYGPIVAVIQKGQIVATR